MVVTDSELMGGQGPTSKANVAIPRVELLSSFLERKLFVGAGRKVVIGILPMPPGSTMLTRISPLPFVFLSLTTTLQVLISQAMHHLIWLLYPVLLDSFLPLSANNDVLHVKHLFVLAGKLTL